MRILDGQVVVSPSDLSNFLSCRHRAGLELAVAQGALRRPVHADPYAAMLQQHGEAHERAYVESIRRSGRSVIDLKGADDAGRQTRAAMQQGIGVIVQARLEGDTLAGYADVLLRVERPSTLGAWSYEVQDTKLARSTKAGTILQLSAYSDLVAHIQGCSAERFQVVVPGISGDSERFVTQHFRVEDYAAYYRMVLHALGAELAKGSEALRAEYYPEPVEACTLCAWDGHCVARRRRDDHPSFIAHAGRSNRVELAAHGYDSLTAVALMPVPVPFEPSRGSRETYDRIGHQARVQHQQRTTRVPVVEHLAVQPGQGLCRLPAPSPGDVFLDLEGARFARDGGREFLFGVWTAGVYQAWWAFDDGAERLAFEAVIDLVMGAWAADAGMHVYHFNHYEPTAFKKLLGRYVTRGAELDRLLRAERFVDLYPVTRQAVRAGVESYSIKQLEQYYGYTRRVALSTVREPLLAVEIALDANAPAAIAEDVRQAVEGYNEDDCRSTEALRDWLEALRARCETEGVPVPRPGDRVEGGEKPPPEIQQQALALRERLLATVAAEAHDPSHPGHPTWLLAYLVDWHRREVNAEWWDYFRLRDLPEDQLLDERKAVAGLRWVTQVEVVWNKRTGKPTGSVIHRYSYPRQEIEIKGKLQLQDGQRFGEVVALDRARRLLDVKQGPTAAGLRPSSAFAADVVPSDTQQASVIRLAERVMAGSDECGTQLLYRRPPRLRSGSFAPGVGETAQQFAVRVASELDRTTLAIQGPPGAGKTFVGAQMILALVRAGRRVGVTATSHKVIRNLLDEVVAQAAKAGQTVRVGAKPDEASVTPGSIIEVTDNQLAVEVIAGRQVDVFGGTAFLWAREELAGAVDVLFVDEAGQLSLANVLAVSQAAESLVLLGDPRQLEQPEKATHPDGVGVSALEHVLGEAETMPASRGLFLPVTWRMSPTLTRFTSELFYAGQLEAKAGLEAQRLEGTDGYDGSHLWFLPVTHDGNQSASAEEVDAVARLVSRLLTPGARAIGDEGLSKPLTGPDLRVVAPFNAQVNRLAERLAGLGVPVGTVDKFQGQTAAVVIYSMTTSRPEDAPRGMEFLYSVNRLNVATSRARCAVFLVASPRLFEPECRTPRQMHLANAMCRYRELARGEG
jgi:predicted RecB family nuclease